MVIRPSVRRTLALDPTSEVFCFAVLEESERLIDWGYRELKARSREEIAARLERIMARYEPELIVLEDMEESRRGQRARTFATAIEALAKTRGIEVERASRREAQAEFVGSGKSKYEIAVAIARLFPELEARLPRKRKPWMTEDKRMGIFDALSFALVVLRRRDSTQFEAA